MHVESRNDWINCRICRQQNSFVGVGHWAWHNFCQSEINPIALIEFIERNNQADAADKILRYVVAITGMNLKAVRAALDEGRLDPARFTPLEEGKAIGSATEELTTLRSLLQTTEAARPLPDRSSRPQDTYHWGETMAQYAALGIGVEAWVELTQAEDRANKRSFHDLSGVTVNWRTFKLVMKVLRAIRIEDFKELETLRTQLVQSESRLTSLTQAQHRLIEEWRAKYKANGPFAFSLCADDLARLGDAETTDLTRTGETSKATDGAAPAMTNGKA